MTSFPTRASSFRTASGSPRMRRRQIWRSQERQGSPSVMIGDILPLLLRIALRPLSHLFNHPTVIGASQTEVGTHPASTAARVSSVLKKRGRKATAHAVQCGL